MSICPKNKSSKGRRNRRRANWKMNASFDEFKDLLLFVT